MNESPLRLDHTTPPLPASGAGSAGTSPKASPSNHRHAMQGLRSRTVLLLGDSITALNFSEAPTYVGTYSYGAAWFTFANMRLGCPFTNIINGGVGGDRSDQILARVPALLAANPNIGYAFVLSGANDTVQGVGPAVTIANNAAIYEMLRMTGIIVIGLTLPPNGGGGYTALKAGKIHTLNRAVMTASDIIPIDTAAAVTEPTTGEWLAGYSTDLVHPTYKAGYAMGAYIAAALAAYGLPRSDARAVNALDGGNLLLGGEFYGNGNVFASASMTVVPNSTDLQANVRGWRVMRNTSGSVATAQSVARADTNACRRLKLDVTAAAAGDGVVVQQILKIAPDAWASASRSYLDRKLIGGFTHVARNITNSTPAATEPTSAAYVGGRILESPGTTWQRVEELAVGDTISAAVDYECSGFTVGFPHLTLKVECQDASYSNILTSWTPFVSPPEYPTRLNEKGTLRSRPITVPANTRFVYVSLGVALGAADTGTVYFDRPELRKS